MYGKGFWMSSATGTMAGAYPFHSVTIGESQTRKPKAVHTKALSPPAKSSSSWCVTAPFFATKRLVLPIMLMLLAGCSANTKALDQFKTTQANLKVAEIPATATAGQNYEYCYGCVVFNYREFGTFEAMPGLQMLSAITHQLRTCKQDNKTFQTHVEVMP